MRDAVAGISRAESTTAAMDAAIRADDAACLAIAAARDDDRETLLARFLEARSHAARVRSYAAGRTPAPLAALA